MEITLHSHSFLTHVSCILRFLPKMSANIPCGLKSFLKTVCAELLRSSPCHLSWRTYGGTPRKWVMTGILLLSLWFLTVVSIFQPYKLSATKDAINFAQFYQVFKEFWVERQQLRVLCCPRWSSPQGGWLFPCISWEADPRGDVRPSSEPGDGRNTFWICHRIGGARERLDSLFWWPR